MVDNCQITTIPMCSCCKTALSLLEKRGIRIDETIHVSPVQKEYPTIILNDKKLTYQEFLMEMKT